MDRQTRTAPAPGGTAEMLGRLGLTDKASAQTIETRYEALVDFLRSAPPELRSWSARQTARIDEAFAVLSDPEQERRANEDADLLDSAVDVDLTDDAPVVTTPPARRWDRKWLTVLGVIVAAAVVIGVYLVGKGGSDVPGINGQTTDEPTTAASAPAIDQAKVGELMKAISSNPKDVASLQSLGDIYFSAGDYKTAADWEQKVLAIDPVNITALLALGAAQYNQGDATNAEKQWLKVVALDANQQEAHYDLGFLYLSQNPPKMDKVQAEWQKVIAIDPNTEVAKTVATHLKGLSSPAAAPKPSAS